MASTRPRTIWGLCWHLLRLRPLAGLALLACVGALLCLYSSKSQETQGTSSARFASFNIEFFPQSDRQVAEAFRVIQETQAAAIGVQEITDPTLFHDEAKRRLGSQWDFVFQKVVAIKGKPPLHIGVVYNTELFQLERVGSRSETRIDDRTQPTLQVRLRERSTGHSVTMLVVHFKALPEGRGQRIAQFAGLLQIIHDLQSQGRSLVVMGDFNATDEGDRTDLDRLAGSSGLSWATRELPCSAFWERAEDCPTSRLDHILSWKAPTGVKAMGGCELGCEKRDSCPLYRREVSDHCPVVLDMPDLSAALNDATVRHGNVNMATTGNR